MHAGRNAVERLVSPNQFGLRSLSPDLLAASERMQSTDSCRDHRSEPAEMSLTPRARRDLDLHGTYSECPPSSKPERIPCPGLSRTPTADLRKLDLPDPTGPGVSRACSAVEVPAAGVPEDRRSQHSPRRRTERNYSDLFGREMPEGRRVRRADVADVARSDFLVLGRSSDVASVKGRVTEEPESARRRTEKNYSDIFGAMTPPATLTPRGEGFNECWQTQQIMSANSEINRRQREKLQGALPDERWQLSSHRARATLDGKADLRDTQAAGRRSNQGSPSPVRSSPSSRGEVESQRFLAMRRVDPANTIARMRLFENNLSHAPF